MEYFHIILTFSLIVGNIWEYYVEYCQFHKNTSVDMNNVMMIIEKLEICIGNILTGESGNTYSLSPLMF